MDGLAKRVLEENGQSKVNQVTSYAYSYTYKFLCAIIHIGNSITLYLMIVTSGKL